MLHAKLIDPENASECTHMLTISVLPERYLQKCTYIIWTSGEHPSVWTLPHVVFWDRYTVVGQERDYMIVERL